ncbi:mitochondrial carrier domain-containing protein [Amylostereum chailletii]|nr:mitochondrial carrier domain-containing protein [Amylostereum chailletii]
METGPDALAPQPLDGARQGSPAVRAAKDITFGSIAGMVSKVLEHPFDLTKVRLQTQVLDATARFNGPLDCLAQTYKNEGIRGLYRGLPAPVVGAMAENATLFLAYGELQNAVRAVEGVPLGQSLSLPQLAIAAAGAGAITSFVLTPVELVKCKMQVQMLIGSPLPSATSASATAMALPGPFEIIRDVLRSSGLRGMWLGHTGTLIRETGGGAAWFSTKEFVASHLLARHSPDAPRELAAWESAVSGACAGAMFNLVLFPADTVKSTMQTEAELRPGTQGGRSFLAVGRELWRAQGLRGLYAGCGITIARSIPSSAIIFWIYDGLRQRFG